MITEKLDADLLLTSPKYRLNNLYNIIDVNGNNIKFKLNHVQENVLDNIHNRNLILKARQLGMSTFAVLYLIDQAIWNPNTSAGIVSYSLEHAQHIFKRIIGHAIDNLPKWLNVPIITRSAREINFENGSVLRVDTTLRGGSYQLVLVSEFGKTCARNPLKAEEIVTGTLQAVPPTGRIIIESTGEGSDGFFAEMVMEASRRGNDNLTPIDYKLFFYPWYLDAKYQIIEESLRYDITLIDYFKSLEEQGVLLTKNQKNWYCIQQKFLREKIQQEYPSTIKEAFLSSSDAYYFAQDIEKAYNSHRCLYTALYDSLLPVYVAMDIGVNDLTVIIFFQIAHGEIRIIDYYEDKNKDSGFYSKFLLQDKRYLYKTIFLPHDSTRRSNVIIENSWERDFRRLFAGTGTTIQVLPRMDKALLISYARQKIDRCVFAMERVKPLVDQLQKYRKKWNEQLGRYVDEDIHSDHADAFKYAMQAIGHIESISSSSVKLEDHRKAVKARAKMIK